MHRTRAARAGPGHRADAVTLCCARRAATHSSTPLPGDGLEAQWVEVTTAPHNLQMALDALASTIGTGVVQTVNQVASYIDYRDFDPSTAGHFDSPDLADPYPLDRRQ